MFIGTFLSKPFEHEHEIGVLDYNLFINDSELRKSGDASAYIKRKIAETWSGLVINHNVPREAWSFSPTEQVQQITGLPDLVVYAI